MHYLLDFVPRRLFLGQLKFLKRKMKHKAFACVLQQKSLSKHVQKLQKKRNWKIKREDFSLLSKRKNCLIQDNFHPSEKKIHNQTDQTTYNKISIHNLSAFLSHSFSNGQLFTPYWINTLYVNNFPFLAFLINNFPKFYCSCTTHSSILAFQLTLLLSFSLQQTQCQETEESRKVHNLYLPYLIPQKETEDRKEITKK